MVNTGRRHRGLNQRMNASGGSRVNWNSGSCRGRVILDGWM